MELFVSRQLFRHLKHQKYLLEMILLYWASHGGLILCWSMIRKNTTCRKQTDREQRKNSYVNYRGHSIPRWIVHYCSTLLISMVMKYCIESIAKYSKVQHSTIQYTAPYYTKVQYNILHFTIIKICYYKMQFMTDSTVQYWTVYYHSVH